MLEHLSTARFIKHINDFRNGKPWKYQENKPLVIVFHEDIELYQKGFRDVYDSLQKKFPKVKFYQVLANTDPELVDVMNITHLPTTVFINSKGVRIQIAGYLTPKQANNDVKSFFQL